MNELPLLESWDRLSSVLLPFLVRCGAAALCGGMIGLERELKGKPAGLRTNILICVGAAMYMIIGLLLVHADREATDVARIAAQVVTGIGFLGAGCIIQQRARITGLTTAATIWVVAAIGIAVGAGQYIEAAGAGALVTLVLAGLGTLEHRLRRARRVLSCTIRARPGYAQADLEELLGASGIRIVGQRVFDHPEDRTYELKLSGPARQFDVVTEKLLTSEDIYGVHVE